MAWVHHSFPLPFCPECGWVSPTYALDGKAGGWASRLAIHASGPVDWRSYPEFRCGCRIVWEAQQKGLVDEACGGHGTGPWTPERLVRERVRQAVEKLRMTTVQRFWGWSPCRLATLARGVDDWTKEVF